MSLEDKAQEHEARIWEFNNRPRDARTLQPADEGYGPEECDECGASMHPVRRGYGFRRCTPCQSALETKPAAGRRR